MSLVPPSQDDTPAPVYRIRTPSGAARPVMIAHRCGAGLGPENTCAAVVQSSFFRPDFYEIDIRHTGDGVAVCFHDETLERTTNAAKILDQTASTSTVLGEFTYSRLRGLDAGGWFGSTFRDEPIPSLETMLDCVNPSPLAIELKEPDITPDRCSAIAAFLEEREDDSSVVLSFHRSALERFREADPARRTCYLARDLDDYAIEGGHEIVGLDAPACTEEVVDTIHEAGKAVWVWTVNEGYERFIEMRVDGIVTDHPDRLRKALPPS